MLCAGHDLAVRCGCSWGGSSVQPASFQRQEPGSGGNRRCSAPHRVESLNLSEIQRKTGGARPANPSNFQGGKLAPGPTTKATEEVYQRAPSPGNGGQNTFCSVSTLVGAMRCDLVREMYRGDPNRCEIASVCAVLRPPRLPRIVHHGSPLGSARVCF